MITIFKRILLIKRSLTAVHWLENCLYRIITVFRWSKLESQIPSCVAPKVRSAEGLLHKNRERLHRLHHGPPPSQGDKWPTTGSLQDCFSNVSATLCIENKSRMKICEGPTQKEAGVSSPAKLHSNDFTGAPTLLLMMILPKLSWWCNPISTPLFMNSGHLAFLHATASKSQDCSYGYHKAIPFLM